MNNTIPPLSFPRFCESLRQAREEAQLTQIQIAQKLQIPVSTYANWEQGRREPSIADIYKILYTLDITPNELFDWD